MVKKYLEFINESSKQEKEYLSNKVSNLGFYFIVYKLKMRMIVDRLLSEMAATKDYNSMYQNALSLLSKTGKFDDIKGSDGSFYTNKLSNLSLVTDDEGRWNPVNKLNTNYIDLSDLLIDVIDLSGKLSELSSIFGLLPTGISQRANYTNEMKSWLENFVNSNDIYSIIISNSIDIRNYTKAIKRNSAIGESAEYKIAELIKNKGLNILYQGGDGDFIDMIYGCDLIVGNPKNDKIYTVQVKSKSENAKKAFDDRGKYPGIDWFCAPIGASMNVFTNGHPNGKLVR